MKFTKTLHLLDAQYYHIVTNTLQNYLLKYKDIRHIVIT